MQRQVAVVGKLYAGKDKDGDFKWMIKQKEYNDTLFLIAENFLDSLLDDSVAVGFLACPQRPLHIFIDNGEAARAI